MLQQNSITILLVEDDLGHAKLIQKNLRRAGIDNNIIHYTDGDKALKFLFREGKYRNSDLPSPMLVVLDLNMPVLDGHEVLKKMKNNPGTHNIPVIVLTTTELSPEIKLCYDQGCNIFIKKPIEYDDFCEAIKKLGMLIQIITVQ